MHQSSEISPETATAVRAELELILKSQAFWRSERHSRFLRFICETTLNGEASKLNEYLIAHTVFDRGADYSSGEDSVVRRQAYSLRQKLKEYYAEEGKNDPVRIELPTGRYVPTFQCSPEPEAAAVPAEIEAPSAAPPVAPNTVVLPVVLAPKVYWWQALAMALAALVFAVAGYQWGTRQTKPGSQLEPVYHRIWGPWLTYYSEGAIVCYSNALTAGIRRTDAPFPPDNPTSGIEIREDEAKTIRAEYKFPAGGFFYMNPTLSHAKMGEALGSIPLAVMFTKAGVPIRAVQSRYMNWQDFRTENLILLGHSEANRWLDPILSNLPFRMAKTDTDKPRRIINPGHKPGEPGEYLPDYTKGHNPAVEDYALISMLGGMDGRHGLTLINGVNTEGTQMALEYLTEAENLRVLENALRKQSPNHTGTWHFQAILHTKLRDGVPTEIELVTTRTLP
ncbi:MAG: hypothetical protein ABJF23_26260 [Bryobacteraceae bacterium]